MTHYYSGFNGRLQGSLLPLIHCLSTLSNSYALSLSLTFEGEQRHSSAPQWRPSSSLFPHLELPTQRRLLVQSVSASRVARIALHIPYAISRSELCSRAGVCVVRFPECLNDGAGRRTRLSKRRLSRPGNGQNTWAWDLWVNLLWCCLSRTTKVHNNPPAPACFAHIFSEECNCWVGLSEGKKRPFIFLPIRKRTQDEDTDSSCSRSSLLRGSNIGEKREKTKELHTRYVCHM